MGKVRELLFPNKGIACVEDTDVIVKNTLPGQEVSFILNKNKPGLKEGRLLEIMKPSDMETEEGCSCHGQCGGCAYQTIPYEEELRIKEGMVLRLMGNALKNCPGEDLSAVYEGITPSPLVSGYRNKMEFSFGNAVKDGPLTLGMHVSGHFMDVLDTPDCNIVDGDFRLIREYVKEYADAKGLLFYHRYTNTGFLRNLLVRKGINTGEILVDIVTTGDGDIGDDFTGGLLALRLSGEITGVLHTVNDSVGDAIKNEATSILYGRDHIFDRVLGLTFKITAFSFFQTNTRGAEVLYDKVREYVKRAVGEDAGIVYDLYSGTGTIAQLVSGVAEKVYGIEIVPEAVEAAKENAERNNINNAEFLCGDVFATLDSVKEQPDLIILDPPREGVTPKALTRILGYGVDNIIYISCKPTSLARDIGPILEAGYTLKAMSVTDMFPRTANMETVALLSKLSSAPKLEVKIPELQRN